MILLHVGNDCFVPIERIITIVPFNTRRIKDEIAWKKKIDVERRDGSFTDATKGKKTASVIICDNGTYVASSVSSVTLAKRAQDLAKTYNKS